MNVSIARIHFGIAASSPSRGRPRHCLTATSSSSTPSTSFSTPTQSAGSEPSCRVGPARGDEDDRADDRQPDDPAEHERGPVRARPRRAEHQHDAMIGIGLSATTDAEREDLPDRVSHSPPRPHDAAEADVAGRRVDRLELARGRPVAQAVVRRAQVRAALDHPARDVLARRAGRAARALGGVRGSPPWSSTPRRCRSRRAGRSRWAGTCRPATCPAYPSLIRFCHGNSPCQVLAIIVPSGANSSPQANTAPSSPPRAAHSHSASVGSALPAHSAYAAASS